MKAMHAIGGSLLAVAVGLAMCGAAEAGAPCGTFQQVNTPNPGATANSLVGLTALADGTAWAVGSKSGAGTLPMILHYDGAFWNEFPVPAEVTGIAFSAAGCTPEGDVWLTGTRPFDVYDREVLFLRVRAGVIDRIDSILSPGAPLDLSATSASDVWALTAVGDVLHFDGTDWTELDVPAPYQRLYPEAIHAAAPDDVWIVGYGGNARAEYRGYVQRGDGTTWSSVATPFDGQQDIFFRDIDGAGSELWLVGYVNYSQHISLRWTGSAWNAAPPPPSNAPLCDVAVLAPDDVWAAPYSLAAGEPFFHWDGTAWTESGAPGVADASTVAWRGLAKVGACDVWAAGSYYSVAHHTLAARLTPGSTPTSVLEDVASGAADLRPSVAAHPSLFRGRTTFAVDLPAAGFVSLAVYDAAGRRVATIEEGGRAAGRHSLGWDASRLAPGRYVVRLESAAGTASGWVTVLK